MKNRRSRVGLIGLPLLLLGWLALLFLCFGEARAQLSNSMSQSFTEYVTLAPPAINTAQTQSNTTGTGIAQTTSGGSIAAGAYRVCVTLFTATNTETPCSTDTAASSVITTTGSTSTITIQPPVTAGAGANVVGWRMYVGAAAGASGAETLQTITASICTLSTSSTASCALTSPAVFTSSSGFTSGSGGPATPGTAIYPPIANAAATALFENSLYRYHVVNWVVTGTAPGTCTFSIQQGSTVAGLANVGQAITCTASGNYALPILGGSTYATVNVSAFTAGDTTTNVQFYYTSLQFAPSYAAFFGNAAPSGNCTNGIAYFNSAAASASTVEYVCEPANTFTAITVP